MNKILSLSVATLLTLGIANLMFFSPATIASSQDDDPEKLEEINTFIKRFPDSWEGYYDRGHFHQRKDERDDAINDYSKALSLCSKNGDLYIRRAEMYLMTTRYEQAIADTNEAIKIFPGWSKAYLKRARIEDSVENFFAAKSDLEKANELKSNDYDTLDTLATTYDNLGEHAKAIEAATKGAIMTQQVDRGGIYYAFQNRGIFWTHAHQYQRAYQDYSLSMMDKPKKSQVWANLAYTLAMDSKLSKAKDAMRICLSLETFMPRGYRLKGEMYRAGGEWEEALKAYKVSTEMEPKYGPAWTQRAVTEIALGMYSEAETDLKKAMEKIPKSTLTFACLALVEDQQGKKEESEQHLKTAIELDPHFAPIYVVRSRVNMNHGDYAKAAEDCIQALTLDPFLGDAYAATSTVLEKTGKHDEAQKFLDKAHEMGWKDMAKELKLEAAAADTSVSIQMPVLADLGAVATEAEKSIGEASPP